MPANGHQCAVTRDRSNIPPSAVLVCAIDYGVGNPELGLKGPQALMRIVETQKRTIQLSRYLELSDWFSRLRVRYALPSRFV